MRPGRDFRCIQLFESKLDRCYFSPKFLLFNVREPHVKHLEGELWEIRMSGKDGIARAIYITATGKRVIVLRAFVKKTPRHEIELSLERAKRIVK